MNEPLLATIDSTSTIETGNSEGVDLQESVETLYDSWGPSDRPPPSFVKSFRQPGDFLGGVEEANDDSDASVPSVAHAAAQAEAHDGQTSEVSSQRDLDPTFST